MIYLFFDAFEGIVDWYIDPYGFLLMAMVLVESYMQKLP